MCVALNSSRIQLLFELWYPAHTDEDTTAGWKDASSVSDFFLIHFIVQMPRVPSASLLLPSSSWTLPPASFLLYFLLLLLHPSSCFLPSSSPLLLSICQSKQRFYRLFKAGWRRGWTRMSVYPWKCFVLSSVGLWQTSVEEMTKAFYTLSCFLCAPRRLSSLSRSLSAGRWICVLHRIRVPDRRCLLSNCKSAAGRWHDAISGFLQAGEWKRELALKQDNQCLDWRHLRVPAVRRCKFTLIQVVLMSFSAVCLCFFFIHKNF